MRWDLGVDTPHERNLAEARNDSTQKKPDFCKKRITASCEHDLLIAKTMVYLETEAYDLSIHGNFRYV